MYVLVMLCFLLFTLKMPLILIGVVLIEKCEVCIYWTKSTRKYIIFVEFYRDLFTNGYTEVLMSFTLQHSSPRNKVIHYKHRLDIPLHSQFCL